MFGKLVLGVALSVALGATAHAATKRCPPLQVGQGQICNCMVQNYSPNTDGDVTLTVFGALSNGQPATCGPVDLDPGESTNCGATVGNVFAFCGCEVVGASSSSKASLLIQDSVTAGARTAVPCQ